MKRPSPDQLRKHIDDAAKCVDQGHSERAKIILVITLTEAVVNISEILEDIAAALDRL